MQTALSIVLATLALALPAQAPGDSQGTWFPPAAREGLSRELMPRLQHVEIGVDADDLLTVARRTVQEMGLRLDTLGADKLMSLAPRLAKLELPMHGQKYLDAMARLGMCTFYLDARYANLTGLDLDARIEAAIGPMTLALSTMYLRHFYLRGGGTDEAIKAYLAGEPLNAVSAAVQKSPDLLRYTEAECRPVVSALLD